MFIKVVNQETKVFGGAFRGHLPARQEGVREYVSKTFPKFTSQRSKGYILLTPINPDEDFGGARIEISISEEPTTTILQRRFLFQRQVPHHDLEVCVASTSPAVWATIASKFVMMKGTARVLDSINPNKELETYLEAKATEYSNTEFPPTSVSQPAQNLTLPNLYQPLPTPCTSLV